MAALLSHLGLLLRPQVVEAAVGLSPVPNGSPDGEGGVLSGVDSLVIQVPDVDLDGRVVLGSDQAVAPGAFFRGGEKHESEKTAEDEKKSILARGLREIVGMRLATATLPLARTPSPRRPGPSPVLRRAAKNRRAERLSWGRGGEGRERARAPSPQRHAALRARPVVAGHLPLAWDVKIHVLSLVVDHGVLSSGASLRLLSSPSAFDSGPWLLFRFDDRRRRNSQHFRTFFARNISGKCHFPAEKRRTPGDSSALLRAQAKERESKRRACDSCVRARPTTRGDEDDIRRCLRL